MRSGSAILVLLAICAAAAWAQDATWLARYDEASTGVSDAPLAVPVSLLWKHTIEAEGVTPIATPAVGPNAVYAPVGDTIYAIDRVTGDVLWEQATGGEIYSSPALVEGILYFGSRDNNLWAVNAEDGSVQWRYPTGGPVDCTPVVAYGVCYFGSDDNRLTALDLESRRPIWQFEANGDIKAPPLVYRDVVVVGSLDRRIYCLNSQGRPLWSNAVARKTFFASPVGERTKVIYASGKELVARDIYSGRLVWGRPFKAADLIVGAPCVLGRRVYIGTRAGAVYAIDANRGEAIWKWPPEGVVGPITSSPVIADDKLVFRAGERDLIAISLDGREMLWKYTLPPTAEKVEKQPKGGGLVIGEDEFDMEGGPIDAPMLDMPDEGGPGVGRPTEQQEETFENVVDPSIAVVENALYVIGEDGVIYGFETDAPDNTPPTISAPVLEVPGAGRQRVQFTPVLSDEEEFPERYAEDIQIPGTPPIFLSLMLTDEGSGINPDAVTVTINGDPADFTYDSREGLIWYIYDPRGAAANLPNGVKRLVFTAEDWRGNRSARTVAFTIDNKLKPPAPPKPKRPEFEGFAPGDEFPEGILPEDMPPEPMD